MEWIECTTEKPIKNQGVIFYSPKAGVEAGYYDLDQRAFIIGIEGAIGLHENEVTHWMPFPNAPDGK